MLRVRQETNCQMDRGGRSQMCFAQSILRRWRQAYKCRGYFCILPSARVAIVNQGGTADDLSIIRP